MWWCGGVWVVCATRARPDICALRAPGCQMEPRMLTARKSGAKTRARTKTTIRTRTRVQMCKLKVPSKSKYNLITSLCKPYHTQRFFWLRFFKIIGDHAQTDMTTPTVL